MHRPAAKRVRMANQAHTTANAVGFLQYCLEMAVRGWYEKISFWVHRISSVWRQLSVERNIHGRGLITYVIKEAMTYNRKIEGLVKITTVGNSVGIVLPKNVLSRMHVEKGDTLYALETPNGVELTPYDPE